MSEARPAEIAAAPATAAPWVLQATGLHKRFHEGGASGLDVNVLAGVDLKVAAGRTLAIVGPSGAGKSTLLHLLGGLEPPSAGRVVLMGRDFASMGAAEQGRWRNRHLGFVYQFHHLLPEFSAAENIVLPQLANGTAPRDAQARAADLLNRVGLAHRADHRPAQMSGGEQQRVAFCRALANQPALLLADEPTGNLDPETSDRVFDVLMGLVRDTGLSALIATHNHALAARMDRVVRLTAA